MNIKYQEEAIKSHLSFALIPSHFISTYLCNFSKKNIITSAMKCDQRFSLKLFIILLLFLLFLSLLVQFCSFLGVCFFIQISLHSILFVWRTLYFCVFFFFFVFKCSSKSFHVIVIIVFHNLWKTGKKWTETFDNNGGEKNQQQILILLKISSFLSKLFLQQTNFPLKNKHS